jgi:hypothetical protein
VPPALSFTTKQASNSSIDQGGGKRRASGTLTRREDSRFVSSVFDLNQIIMPPKSINSFATFNRDPALG